MGGICSSDTRYAIVDPGTTGAASTDYDSAAAEAEEQIEGENDGSVIMRTTTHHHTTATAAASAASLNNNNNRRQTSVLTTKRMTSHVSSVAPFPPGILKASSLATPVFQNNTILQNGMVLGEHNATSPPQLYHTLLQQQQYSNHPFLTSSAGEDGSYVDPHHYYHHTLSPPPPRREEWSRPHHGLGDDDARTCIRRAFDSSLFASACSSSQLDTLASQSTIHSCIIGQRIFGQHDPCNDESMIYLIEQGQVHLEVGTEQAKNADGSLPTGSQQQQQQQPASSPHYSGNSSFFSHSDDEDDLDDCYPLTHSEAFHTSSPNLGTFLSPLHGRLTLAESQATCMAHEAAEEAKRAKEAKEAFLLKREAEKQRKEKERSERLKLSSDNRFRGMAAGILNAGFAVATAAATGGSNNSNGNGTSMPGIVSISSSSSSSTHGRAVSMGTNLKRQTWKDGFVLPSLNGQTTSTTTSTTTNGTSSSNPPPLTHAQTIPLQKQAPLPSSITSPSSTFTSPPTPTRRPILKQLDTTSNVSHASPQTSPLLVMMSTGGFAQAFENNGGAGGGGGVGRNNLAAPLQQQPHSASLPITRKSPTSSPTHTSSISVDSGVPPIGGTVSSSVPSAIPVVQRPASLLILSPVQQKGKRLQSHQITDSIATTTGDESSEPHTPTPLKRQNFTPRERGVITPNGNGDRSNASTPTNAQQAPSTSPSPTSQTAFPPALAAPLSRDRRRARRRTNTKESGEFGSPPHNPLASPTAAAAGEMSRTPSISPHPEGGGSGGTGRERGGILLRRGSLSSTGGHQQTNFFSGPENDDLPPRPSTQQNQHAQHNGMGDDITSGLIRIGVFHQGHVLGTCSLSGGNDGTYLSTAVIHSQSTRVVAIPRKVVMEMMNENVQAATTTQSSLRDTLSSHLQHSLTSTSWLAHLPSPSAFTLLSSLFTYLSIPPSTILFQNGDCTTDASCLYLILRGEIIVELADDRTGKIQKKVLGRGAWCGELSVIVGLCRTGTAYTAAATSETSTEDTLVYTLTRRSLLRFFNSYGLLPLSQLASTSLLASYPPLRDEQYLEQMTIQSSFARFCLKEYSAENIEFWQTAIRLRKVLLTPSGGSAYSRSQVLTEIALLYTRYISERSLIQINLKQQVREVVRKALQSGVITSVSFRPAEQEILHLMIHDNYSRYKNSREYTQVLKELECAQPFAYPKMYLMEPSETETLEGSSLEQSPKFGTGVDSTSQASPPPLPLLPWQQESLSRCTPVSITAQFIWNEAAKQKGSKEEEICFDDDGYVLEKMVEPVPVAVNEPVVAAQNTTVTTATTNDAAGTTDPVAARRTSVHSSPVLSAKTPLIDPTTTDSEAMQPIAASEGVMDTSAVLDTETTKTTSSPHLDPLFANLPLPPLPSITTSIHPPTTIPISPRRELPPSRHTPHRSGVSSHARHASGHGGGGSQTIFAPTIGAGHHHGRNPSHGNSNGVGGAHHSRTHTTSQSITANGESRGINPFAAAATAAAIMASNVNPFATTSHYTFSTTASQPMSSGSNGGGGNHGSGGAPLSSPTNAAHAPTSTSTPPALPQTTLIGTTNLKSLMIGINISRKLSKRAKQIAKQFRDSPFAVSVATSSHSNHSTTSSNAAGMSKDSAHATHHSENPKRKSTKSRRQTINKDANAHSQSNSRRQTATTMPKFEH